VTGTPVAESAQSLRDPTFREPLRSNTNSVREESLEESEDLSSGGIVPW
jgi:hypothetical protein